LAEDESKPETLEKIGKRIELFREVISRGIAALLEDEGQVATALK